MTGPGMTGPGHHPHGAAAGTGHGYDDPNYNTYAADTQPYAGQHGAMGGMGAAAPYNETTHGHGHRTAGVPPTGNLNNSGQNRGGAGLGMTGKVEKAVGSMVGSSALKAKGLQKEQEANALKAQSLELEEAERLEQEARMRRQRAVDHGAHPDQSGLGGRLGNY